MKVYIGYDDRESAAAMVAAKSLQRVTRGQIEPEFLCLPKLYDQGLLWRPLDTRGEEIYDLVSHEYTSTQFKISRFLVPIICTGGPALFVDCDVIFERDPREMLNGVNMVHAVSCVQHRHHVGHQRKMVNQSQRWYPRKNWSSVMLFNCDHHANRRLSLRDVNSRRAEQLHGLYWLNDVEIGELTAQWNWLVDVQPKPADVGIAHMTLGGPWLPGWSGGSYDERWLAEAAVA